MDCVCVVGVDPGETTGIAALRFHDGEPLDPIMYQATHLGAHWLVSTLLGLWVPPGHGTPGREPYRLALAVERFVDSSRSSRAASQSASRRTRALISTLEELAQSWKIPLVKRSAAEVKPWATNARLEAIRATPPGMPHARDGARHALFEAVRNHGVPDPLSRR